MSIVTYLYHLPPVHKDPGTEESQGETWTWPCCVFSREAIATSVPSTSCCCGIFVRLHLESDGSETYPGEAGARPEAGWHSAAPC